MDRRLNSPPADAQRRAEGALTRRLHRGFFAVVAHLPESVARQARSRLFDALQAGGSRWAYDTCPYEAAKRRALVAAVPAEARVVVEIGCSDGHNLPALSQRAPDARVLGVDISQRACALARSRTLHLPRVSVSVADIGSLATRMPHLRESVDVVVLSEVLYYLGGPGALKEQLTSLIGLLARDGRIVMAHGSDDAAELHARATHALALPDRVDETHAVNGRSFLITSVGRFRDSGDESSDAISCRVSSRTPA